MPIKLTLLEQKGDITDIRVEEGTFERNIRPATKFTDGLDILDSKYNIVERIEFTVSSSYKDNKNGEPHKESIFAFNNAIIPPKSYFKELLESYTDAYEVVNENNVCKAKNLIGNDIWLYSGEGYKEKGLPAFVLSPKAELDFITLFKKVNNISDSDYTKYISRNFMPWFNSANSKELQCLEYADQMFQIAGYERQKEDFLAHILQVWNSGLLSLRENQREKTDVSLQVIPVTATPTRVTFM